MTPVPAIRELIVTALILAMNGLRGLKQPPVRIGLISAELLRGQRTDYVLSSEALTYISEHKLPQSFWLPLSFAINRVFKDKEEWLSYLKELGIQKKSHVKTATEGALLGAVIASGVSADLGIVSDGAGQFRLLEHGLCSVHAERLINKLIPFTIAQRLAVETVQDQIWDLYQDLKAYKKLAAEEQQQQKANLEERFDQIFTTTTSFETRGSSAATAQETQG